MQKETFEVKEVQSQRSEGGKIGTHACYLWQR